MLPLRWPWRRSEPPEKTNELFPFLSTSAVNPKLLIPMRQRQNWSPWVLFATLAVIAIALALLAKSKVILGLLHRVNASSSWLHNSEAFLWAGVVCIVLSSVLALWLLPRWQVSSLKALTPEGRFDKENESRKTLAQIICGLFVIASLFSTARTLQVSQEQAAISSRQAETAAKQVQVAQEGQFTDRFTKAIDQLGRKDQLEVRLGAIYALERIANDSPKDHWPVMEVLTAYVRESAPQQKTSNKASTDKSIRADIQAILTILGRRDRTKERESDRLDLHEAHLSGADLMFAFLGRADLSRILLRSSNSSFGRVKNHADHSHQSLQRKTISG